MSDLMRGLANGVVIVLAADGRLSYVCRRRWPQRSEAILIFDAALRFDHPRRTYRRVLLRQLPIAAIGLRYRLQPSALSGSDQVRTGSPNSFSVGVLGVGAGAA